MNHPDVVPICLRVAAGDIALIKFLFESYEGLAVVRTVDRTEAIIAVLAVADHLATVRALLDSIRTQCAWQEVPSRPGDEWLLADTGK
jgi:hypothetical protein